jgi:hypothetical protein
MSGAGKRPRAMSSSFAMPMTLCWVFSSGQMLSSSLLSSGNGWRSLELHPDKTRLVEFGRYRARDRKQRGEGKPETFKFLGFTQYGGQRHKTETFTFWRITAKKRMVAKLKAIKAEHQCRMHDRTSQVVYGFARSYRATTNTTLFPDRRRLFRGSRSAKCRKVLSWV